MSSTTVAQLAPDLAQARAFLAALDPSPGALFGFRTFDDRGDDPRLAVKAFGTLDAGTRQSPDPAKGGKPCRPGNLLAFMQGRGAGAFVVVNALDGLGQRKVNVQRIRDLCVDADTWEQVEASLAFIARACLIPTAIVASGGIHEGIDKLQIYWRVNGCPVDAFTFAQLTLVSRLGTDPAVQDASRVMRVPGFYHQKREPRMSRIEALSPGLEYGFESFLTRVRSQPQICDPWAGGKRLGGRTRQVAAVGRAVDPAGATARLRMLLDRHGGLVTPAVRDFIREAVAPLDGAPGNRHDTLLAVAARLVQVGWPDADIQALVQPAVLEHWGVDRSERLAGMLAWARGKEAAALANAPALSASAEALAKAFGARRGTE